MTNTVAYCETVLPELAYLVAQNQPQGNPLNAVANLSSYFERDSVLGFGREVHAARREPEVADDTAAEQLQIAAWIIADCRTAFSARSSSQREATVLYFTAPTGIAEIVLIAGQAWVTTHHDDNDIATLLVRHLVDPSSLTILMRQDIAGDRRYLALSENHRAQSTDGISWESASGDMDHWTAVGAFVR